MPPPSRDRPPRWKCRRPSSPSPSLAAREMSFHIQHELRPLVYGNFGHLDYFSNISRSSLFHRHPARAVRHARLGARAEWMPLGGTRTAQCSACYSARPRAKAVLLPQFLRAVTQKPVSRQLPGPRAAWHPGRPDLICGGGPGPDQLARPVIERGPERWHARVRAVLPPQFSRAVTAITVIIVATSDAASPHG